MFPYVAIDFETADNRRDSACAVGLVRVEGGEVTHAVRRLIRPPRRRVMFTGIHGLRWRDLKDQPPFPTVWRELAPLLDGSTFLAAHNAPFDRSVLRACCKAAGLPQPAAPFLCTVQLARRAWDLRPTRLPDVCRHLELPLDHHDPLSDARACAAIVLAGRATAREMLAAS